MGQNQKWLLTLVLASLAIAGCAGRKSKQPDLGASAEPDKVLYDRAMDDIRRGRHEIARLTLQTLINTYPDSEYLAKAKLAIADSYYKEGGTAGLTQAVSEYKDFITFFPFLDEAAYAQLQVGMAHYRRMEKPDRDRSWGRLAEEEFQVFLQKHPNHALAPQVEQRLREVQEILAEGEFRIARFYYVKGSYRASGTRLLDLTNRYSLFSRGDEALWMLATIYERAEQPDIAAQQYGRIVRDYPLSNLVKDATKKLAKLGTPVPQPNPEAVARMQREREFERNRPGMLKRSMGIFRSGPDVSMAARTGKPTLTPAGEPVPGTETLTPGGTLSVGVAGTTPGSSSNSPVVATVPAGSPESTSSSGDPVAAETEKTEANATGDKSATEPAKANASAKDKKDDEKKAKEKKAKEKKKKKESKPEPEKKEEPLP